MKEQGECVPVFWAGMEEGKLHKEVTTKLTLKKGIKDPHSDKRGNTIAKLDLLKEIIFSVAFCYLLPYADPSKTSN